MGSWVSKSKEITTVVSQHPSGLRFYTIGEDDGTLRFTGITNVFVPSRESAEALVEQDQEAMRQAHVCGFCEKESSHGGGGWGMEFVCEECKRALRGWPGWTEEDVVDLFRHDGALIGKAHAFANRQRKIHNAKIRRKNRGAYYGDKKRCRSGAGTTNRILTMLRASKFAELGYGV